MRWEALRKVAAGACAAVAMATLLAFSRGALSARGGWIDVHAPLPRSRRREAGEKRQSGYGKIELAEVLGPVSPTHHLEPNPGS